MIDNLSPLDCDHMLSNPFTGQKVTRIVADHSGKVSGRHPCRHCMPSLPVSDDCHCDMCDSLKPEARIQALTNAVNGLLGLLVFNGDEDKDLVLRFGRRGFEVIQTARDALRGAK